MIALVVSGVGMLLLFLALGVLYGLMYLMTALIKDRPEARAAEQGSQRAGEPGDEGAGAQRAMQQRAAAAAVALARAESELGGAGAPGAEDTTGRGRSSGWQALHHQRQLTLNARRRRGR